ncbi:hypothetical protein FQA47_013215 [Oryzias melastigma]|uniref:Uncharacterized protein n=1 Tax=Oryzias melastigma TaxID=30732 RepID=A0A834FHI0_ORYME|nr:hypothetical protein FQA47_013215 [Oryzias melastigma]
MSSISLRLTCAENDHFIDHQNRRLCSTLNKRSPAKQVLSPATAFSYRCNEATVKQTSLLQAESDGQQSPETGSGGSEDSSDR